MVCVVCNCCATSAYRELCRAKGGIGSGETLYNITILINVSNELQCYRSRSTSDARHIGMNVIPSPQYHVYSLKLGTNILISGQMRQRHSQLCRI